MRPIVVAKVGGSLFDLPDLAGRLRVWRRMVLERTVVLVPGGGAAADVIRQFDRTYQLGEEAAHWLALRMLCVNGHFLSGLLGVPVVSSIAAMTEHDLCVLDAHAFARQDEGRAGSLPHSWDVTSDSISARVAAVLGARLVLLKSTGPPADRSWPDATRAELVDRTFPRVIAESAVDVTWVNLRQPQFAQPK